MPVAPNKFWEKFLNRFQEIETLDVKKWKEIHVLAYICKRFKSLYGRDFSFSFQSSPTKSAEFVAVKKIIPSLSTTNMVRVKQYVDWVYDSVIIPKKMKIRSLFIFNSPGMANQFYFELDKIEKIDRTTLLPSDIQSIVSEMNLPISTYGDLAFVKMALDQTPNHPTRALYKDLFDLLAKNGFMLDVLDSI